MTRFLTPKSIPTPYLNIKGFNVISSSVQTLT